MSIFTLMNWETQSKEFKDRPNRYKRELKTRKLEKFFLCLVPEHAYVYENQYVDIYFDELGKRGLKNFKTNRIVINANEDA